MYTLRADVVDQSDFKTWVPVPMTALARAKLNHHHWTGSPSFSSSEQSTSSMGPSGRTKSTPRSGVVPFNRLQLAAALIEYNNSADDCDSTGIDWSVQEMPARVSASPRRAPNSAIFIPFRQVVDVKPVDFFSGIGLPSQASEQRTSLSSGPAIVHPTPSPGGSGDLSRTAVVVDNSHKRALSSTGVVEAISNPSSPNPQILDAFQNAEREEIEVLSEWGLDGLLVDPDTKTALDKGKSKQIIDSSTEQANSESGLVNTPQLRSGKLATDVAQRRQIKSDLFDLHLSDSRTQSSPAGTKGRSSGVDLLSQPINDSPNLGGGAALDDEQLMRQTVWSDSDGRQLMRPRSVMELAEINFMTPGSKPTPRLSSAIMRAKQIQQPQTTDSRQLPHHHKSARDAQPPRASVDARLRARSLSPSAVLVINPTDTSALHQSKNESPTINTEQGVKQPPNQLSPRTRRKSTLDQPSSSLSNNLLPSSKQRSHQRVKSSSSIISVRELVRGRKKKTSDGQQSQPMTTSSRNNSDEPTDSVPKPKPRTSQDIAQRYQQSIALLESRKVEDLVYQVDTDSQTDPTPKEEQLENLVNQTTNEDQSSVVRPSGEFSLGVPKEFTSRFDPKVVSVLGQVSNTGTNEQELSDHDDDEDLDDDYHTEQQDENDDSTQPIYDELGRVRFPTSLKPLVLIMPIPLTPHELESEEEDEVEKLHHSGPGQPPDGEVEESEEMKVIKKWEQQRPAGKLYGRSLIDELNSRKGAQKNKNMTFTGDDRPKMFANLLSPNDADRPNSIYSSLDPAEGKNLGLPKSPSSPLHLANQALNATQSRFSQALLDSSKARKSVFGMDMIMVAELEKLKKIRAQEELEIKEMEIQEAQKQAKKQGKKKKKKKKKGDEDDEVEVAEEFQVREQLNHRASSYMNEHWDAILDREVKPPVPRPVSQLINPTPLPVITTPELNSNPNQIGNMNDWFGDQNLDGEIDPSKSPSINFENSEEDDGFGNANSLARRLEIQAEKMNYKPLHNAFDGHQLTRHASLRSQAAMLAFTRGNTPILGASSTIESDDHEPLANPAREKYHRQSHLNRLEAIPVNTKSDDEDDNIPLSKHRKSRMALKVDKSDDEDDNRPLSCIGLNNKIGGLKLKIDKSVEDDNGSKKMGPARFLSLGLDSNRLNSGNRSPSDNSLLQASSTPRTTSSQDADEELPLGIRYSILMSKKHPPIDLTHEVGSEDGPIGSEAGSDDSDEVPLGIRASTILPRSAPVLPPLMNQNNHTSDDKHSVGAQMNKLSIEEDGDEDDIPLGYRASAIPTFTFPPVVPSSLNMNLMNSLSTYPTLPRMETIGSSSKSIGGQSDDIPLGMKYDGLNRMSIFQSIAPALDSSSKSIGGQSDDMPLGMKFKANNDDDDDDDDQPLANRMSRLNPTFSFPSQPSFHPSQFVTQLRPTAQPLSSIQQEFDEKPKDDSDDHIPLAQRASSLPKPGAVARRVKEIESVRSKNERRLKEQVRISTLENEEPSFEKSFSSSPAIEEFKATNDREDTLAALEGRIPIENPSDEDIPLGITMAAHTTSTIKRNKNKK